MELTARMNEPFFQSAVSGFNLLEKESVSSWPLIESVSFGIDPVDRPLEAVSVLLLVF